MSVKSRSISLIIVCQVASMTLWFSASAAVPGLLADGIIDTDQASLLTGAVQLGFVFGTLLSAGFGLPDRLDPRRLFAACALAGAAANAAILATGMAGDGAIILRFITGMMMAGIYPVGMKLAAGWAQKNMGLMVGALVGALTLGSALPHLFNALSALEWRSTLTTASACAVAAAVLIGGMQLGPSHHRAATFHPRHALANLRRRSVVLANCGYFGHMWELYAMWAWIGTFLAWALPRAGLEGGGWAANSAFMTFLVVASGAIGCLWAGWLADRIGRTLVTAGAMIISGTCAATIGLMPEVGVAPLLLVALIWGVSVIADSAQFSAAVAELSEPHLVGTTLTLQTCTGFLITFAAIQMMPAVIDLLTWRWAFAVLAIGPFLGAAAMLRLRRTPDAVRIAHGRR